MVADCPPGECENDPTYDEPYVAPPLPVPVNNNDDGGGDASSYTLPVASAATLGVVKSKDAAWYIIIDADGYMKLANAEGVAHDLDNYHKLSAIVGKVTDDDVDTLKYMTQYATNWRSDTTYKKGDLLSYGEGLYLIIKDHTSGEDFPIVEPAIRSDEMILVAEGGNTIAKSRNLPNNVFYNVSITDYNTDKIILHFVNKDLFTGGDSAIALTIDAAVGTHTNEEGETQPGHAGIMTANQAETLQALAEAYKSSTQGIILYEGSASVNYVDLSESANNYDHIKVVGEYISTGSASFHQGVNTEFYPNGETNSFQLNAIDIVANDTPVQTILQDIWQINEDGTELSLVSGFKSTLSGVTPTLEVTPETTSIFTITKVVGYGKKV